ncbi:unnamed protein product, partial [Mesorhabditis belari]|uniref:Uncharacterized protein n=1 Tax=Mesorhabditis belari TaxID=2138241 RepID=A0AAF3F1G6_9BILA
MYRGKPLLAHPRPRLPLVLYIISIVLSSLLFYWAGVYCRWNYYDCSETLNFPMKNREYAQYFPIFVGPLICLLSVMWLMTNVFYANTPCANAYNCLEMPTAVFSSLLAGVSAVIEIHYSFDFNRLIWSEQWSWAAADAVALGAVHAFLAFALQ